MSNIPIKDRSRKPLLTVEEQNESIEETETAVRRLRNGKAPGLDEITTELLKSRGRMLAEHLTRLFNDCWQQAKVPEDWKRGVTVKLPKKEDTTESNN
ncbi:hypothetical protein ANCDUO_00178 [Ancylostoma duodenale]|uniref:Reverse transcriptase domain-containing protein n=1 Tax=Ancylostoma duodenale TaxID=51022 RepID=A0A0C2HCR1_9BILA|nr:hypothetical protein ANCDUO_00178 [Ancylostoma duodenale]